MGGCCGAMKTGQKSSLPDKKKSADPIQEKTNGREAAQATVSANDTAKASIDEGHAEQKPKDVEGHAQEQIAAKVSFSHAEPAQSTVEAPVQTAENVMDLDTAVAPFESLPSNGDHSQQEAQGSITSAEPEVLLPFQIPVQHTFTSTTTTTTTIRHEENHEEFKLRVDEPQLDAAFPGGVQLSITEYGQDAKPEEAPVSGDAIILARSFAAAEVEAVPEPLSAGNEDAVTRVERAILEAQLPVEEDLPPPPPLEVQQPEEFEARGHFEVDASVPVPAPLEEPSELEPRPDEGVQICPLERQPSPEPRPDEGVQICPLERQPSPEPRPDEGVQICPLERQPSPEPRPGAGVQICPLERRPSPEPRPDAGVQICPLERRPSPEPRPDSGVQICPLERRPSPEPRPDAGVQICPLERRPSPEPRPDAGVQICPLERRPSPEPRPDAGVQICPLERRPSPEPRPDAGVQICPLERQPSPEPRPGAEVQICPLERRPSPEPRPYSGIQICPLERQPYPEPRPEDGVQICPLEQQPYPEPITDEGVQICPLEQQPNPEPIPDEGVQICPLEQLPYPKPIPDEGVQICPLERQPSPELELRPAPEIAICPHFTGDILDEGDEQSKALQEDVTSVEVPATSFVQEQVSTDLGTQPASEPTAVPESILLEESNTIEEAAVPVVMPPTEVSFTEEPHFQEQAPYELGFGSNLDEKPQIPAEDDLPPPAVEDPATYDSLLESYEVLGASDEQLPPPLPVEADGRSAEPNASFPDNEQFGEKQPLPDQTEQIATTTQQEQLSEEEPVPYQEQQHAELLEPYHEQQGLTPYQEHQPEESAFQPEHQLQDPASQQTSGTFEQFSLQGQEPSGEPSDALPVLEVVSEQAQQSRDAWWNESGKEQSGQQTTTDDIPVLELVSEQVRESHEAWWNQSGAAATDAAQPAEEAVTSILETAAQSPTEQVPSSEEPSSIPLSETQLAETAPIQPEETISPNTDGSFPEEVTPEPVPSSSDPVIVDQQQEAAIIPETKELPIVESPLSADGSSTVPTENGEVSTQSSDETTSLSNLSPESIDGPTAAAAAAVRTTEEPIPAQA